MPAYTTIDLLAQYRFKLGNRDAHVQLNVKNVTNKEYRESNFAAFGDPRNFLISLATKF